MRKINWIIVVVFIVVSAFLLWLWYYLAFNRVDNPLDLVLSIILWIIVATMAFAIAKVEKARRRRVRTIYVGRNAFFNSEKGMVPYADRVGLVDETERLLNRLKYGFTREDLPKYDEFVVDFIIRTDEFKERVEYYEDEKIPVPDGMSATTVAASANTIDDAAWKGEVVFVRTKEEHPFENKAQLVRIINAI